MVDFDEGRDLLQLEKTQLKSHGRSIYVYNNASMAYIERHSHVVTIHLSKQINEQSQAGNDTF